MGPGHSTRTGRASRISAARRVYGFYCLSGFVSLAYQVTWFRLYVDQFGSTNLTFILVLCNFIAGLGFGALASRRLAAWLGRVLRIQDRLRVYGVAELLVSGTALITILATLLPADAWGAFPYVRTGGVYVQTLPYQLGKVGIAMGCVFVPCFFMGVTFPLLCAAFGDDERFPSNLYAWNTLGACSGVLLCEFVFIPWIGHYWTFWLAAGVNALIGACFLVAGGSPGAIPEPGPPASGDGPDPAPAPGSAAVLITCALLSGLLAGAVEGDMFRRIKFVGYATSTVMSFASFWAILGIFLASLAVSRLRALRLVHIKVAFALALIFYVVVGRLVYPIHDEVVSLVSGADASPGWALRFPTGTAQLLLFSGILVFPTYLLVSLLLPYVCNRIQARRRHLGLAYGVNTLAFCLGTVSFTWIAPRVSAFYSMKLMPVVFGIGTILLLLISETRRLAAWKPILAALGLVIACIFTPSGFDATYLYPGGPPTRFPVRAMRSNGAQTTYVVSAPYGELLYYDNISLSNTSASVQTYMRLMAHLPLLSDPDPKDALLICYGVGNTAAAIASHETIERIDVVELNRNVIETAPEFASATDDVYRDPRVRFINDDGRNFLRMTDRSYDLITSEPPPPLHEGVYRLYSREYYEDALRHLKPGGLMTQWLPAWQLPAEAGERIISTFIEVFPHVVMFAGATDELILVGGAAPMDLSGLAKRFYESPRVLEDLRKLDIRTPSSLLLRLVKGDAGLRREYGGKPIIRDRHNDLAHLFLDPRQPMTVAYDPVEVLSELAAAGVADQGRLRGMLLHLGRLVYHAPVFPPAWLDRLRGEQGVALTDVDWRRVDALQKEYLADRRAGRGRMGVARLRAALQLTDYQLPTALLALAREYLDEGRIRPALSPLHRFMQLEPEEAVGYRLLGKALLRLGEYDEAIDRLQRAVELDPRLGDAHDALRNALQARGRLHEAGGGADRAGLATSP